MFEAHRPPADLFLSLTDRLRQTDHPTRLPAALVLTVDVAGLLLARLFALVEGKLSGKEVLFTLVIERLLRKRRSQKEEEEGNTSDVGLDRMRCFVSLPFFSLYKHLIYDFKPGPG